MENVTNEKILEKVIEAGNKILNQTKIANNTLQKSFVDIKTNQTGIRNLHSRLSDIESDLSIVKTKVSRIEKMLNQLLEER